MMEIVITVDPRVCRLSAVKKTAYRLGDRCVAQIDIRPDASIQVRLTARSGKPLLPTVEDDFLSELLDQELRESIAQETERVRNLLLAQAFSGLSWEDAAADTADFRDDPLGIARSQNASL